MKNVNHIFVIAEAGVNHNGSPNTALRLVEEAAKAGADAVKFQTFRAENLASQQAPKAAYQGQTTDPGESQLEMLKKLELSEDLHRSLLLRCQELGIEFLSTAFDLESLRLLDNLGVQRLKIPSGEITSGPLLLAAARTGKPVILSTGMSGLGDIEAALGVLAFGYLNPTGGKPSLPAFDAAYASGEGRCVLAKKVALLHCTTQYPAPPESANLLAMGTMARAFGLPIGYSDHTPGLTAAIAAVAMGAAIIEKHFTLDRALPGPDHKASLEPADLSQLILMIRDTEKMLGSAYKIPSPAEINNMAIARKCLVAARDIAKGEIFDSENMVFKRPGNGISPMRYWEFLGASATRDYRQDEPI